MGMVQRRRRRDLSTLDGLVRAGRLQVVNPTTDTGWRSYDSGGRLFLPGATNYCTNPRMVDGDASGKADLWTCGGSAVQAYSIVAGALGGYAQRIQLVGAGGFYHRLNMETAVGSFSAGEVATLSFYYKSAKTGAMRYKCFVEAQDAAGASLGYAAMNLAVPDAADWTRLVLTTSALPVGTSKLSIQPHYADGGAVPGDTCDVSIANVQLEKSPFPTPYFDGSTANCAWTGTANASPSTRTASALQLPVTANALNSGTVAAVVTPLYAGNTAIDFGVFNIPSTMELFHRSNSTWTIRTNGVSRIASAGLKFSAGTRHTLVGRWTQGGSGVVDINHDATDVAQAAQPATLVSGTAVKIGDTDAAASAAAAIGPVLISPYRKSDAWVTAIQANSGAAYNDPVRLYREFMSPGDMLIPLQGDSRAYKKV